MLVNSDNSNHAKTERRETVMTIDFFLFATVRTVRGPQYFISYSSYGRRKNVGLDNIPLHVQFFLRSLVYIILMFDF